MSKRPRTAPVPPVAGRVGFTDLPDGAWVDYKSRPFGHTEAARLFDELRNAPADSPWAEQTLRVYGQQVRAPQATQRPLMTHA